MPALDTIADVLNDLLGAELGSLFASAVASGSHAGLRGAGLRRTMQYVAEADARRAGDVAALIESLGLEPAPSRQQQEPVESYLSIDYILPRLIADKQCTLQAYRDAVAQLSEVSESIAALLRRHLTEHAGELEILAGDGSV
ncbi:hypothetical protein [Humisphaera borealis]|uniref:Uncharacterized protein n=1 Tax=Humisphaera borealis TaxID=2807512 RepID=A0A7M2WXF0_9BACT|nr:hypothetical protein [Humisphaera borealis]QOV90208.1 hypothetical protein IPV69_02205 [Humisphaera borealis]